MEYKKLGELPPAPQEMRRTFAAPALTVQQSMRGCFQECFGCEAQTEYRVYSGHVEQGQPRAQGIRRWATCSRRARASPARAAARRVASR